MARISAVTSPAQLGEVAAEADRRRLRRGPSAANLVGFGKAAPSRILLRSIRPPKQSLGEGQTPNHARSLVTSPAQLGEVAAEPIGRRLREGAERC